ncbi:Hypothetical_protein [Hexamita inflata]|uniref:Hypothetical_protein n=1 Tax=Hexamita inflata TaxID=28002 RepID=A0AA86NLV9_9EUKA|nr:Hypothetical protein HINF_LOCUS8901 [Hexamita inflata]
MHCFINLIRLLGSFLVHLFLQILISGYIAGGELTISQSSVALISFLVPLFSRNCFQFPIWSFFWVFAKIGLVSHFALAIVFIHLNPSFGYDLAGFSETRYFTSFFFQVSF